MRCPFICFVSCGMPAPIEELKKLTNAIHPLQDEAMEAFTATFSPFKSARKQSITMAGQKERFLYFVTAGVQRVYETDEQGNETTILFTYPYSFGGVLDSFMLHQASRYHYETLTPSAFLRAGYTDLERVRNQYPAIEQMICKGIAGALSGVLLRLSEVQRLTAAEKLRRLMQRSPQVFGLVPQKYLANYIGIDPTNFSKLVNKVRL